MEIPVKSMDLFAVVVSVLLIAPGAWIIFLNWSCVYSALRKKSSSWIPLLGAGLCATGLYQIPGMHAYIGFPFCWTMVPSPVWPTRFIFHIRRLSAKQKCGREAFCNSYPLFLNFCFLGSLYFRQPTLPSAKEALLPTVRSSTTESSEAILRGNAHIPKFPPESRCNFADPLALGHLLG
jgi:hypothetical protein